MNQNRALNISCPLDIPAEVVLLMLVVRKFIAIPTFPF